MIATAQCWSWPTEELVLRLIECFWIVRPEPVQLELVASDGPLARNSLGEKLCADCGLVPIAHQSNGRRCHGCFVEHKRRYWKARHLEKKATVAANAGLDGTASPIRTAY